MSENDIDVIGLARKDNEVCIEMFYVRNSKMIGREHFIFKGLEDEEDSEILSSFIKQYYVGRTILPNKIMIRDEIEDKDTIEMWLTGVANRKVEIKTPQKGEKLRFVEMAENNALITLKNKEKDKYNILAELKQVLNLEVLPRKIESFDISNLSGTNQVAGMSVMQDGVIKKSMARRFKVKTVLGQDDPKCMEEVVTRRLKHSVKMLNNGDSSGFGELPDLILADGGITQIRAIKQAIKNVNNEIKAVAKEKNIELTQKDLVNIPVFGMVKNDKHQTRALMDENRNELEISQNLMNVITQFQDTVHDTAITYHRKLRDKSITKSKLDDIPGVGEVKKKELLKYFGSVKKIQEATIEELMQVKGINEKIAKELKEQLNS